MKNDKGQSTVEYILLLSVLVSLSIMVFKSEYFENLFGPNSQFFERMRKTMEYSYRHGLTGTDGEANYDGTSEHDSYFKGGNTRFFTPTDAYPEN